MRPWHLQEDLRLLCNLLTHCRPLLIPHPASQFRSGPTPQQVRWLRIIRAKSASDRNTRSDVEIRKSGPDHRAQWAIRRGGPRTVGPSFDTTLVNRRERVPNRVVGILSGIRRELEDIDVTDERDRSRKEAPDTKRRWHIFEKIVRHFFQSVHAESDDVPEIAGVDLQKLRADVYIAADGTNSTYDITRLLRFAFFDFTLGPRSTSSIKALAEHADLRYPTEWYHQARSMQRQIHLHVGPTNSGKTYNALKRLEDSGHGFYAGPLRLLAHEVYSRFKAKGIPCDLVTGDDVRKDAAEDVQLTASTVEMVNTSREVEIAVIDEAQMMAHEERGWAWTRAFLGANAKEVHLCGEPRIVPLVTELTASMGDSLHIHRYERLSPLKAASRSLGGELKRLRKGDCVVAFTILTLHALKREIELQTGRRVAIVYGSLPPETRARQAELFNDPDNDYDYLVASNAIGMGLNLAIKRIVFHSISKFNGIAREKLSVADVKQIAGRAGRFRTAHQAKSADTSNKTGSSTPVGFVTCLHDEDLPYIQKALGQEPEPLTAAGIFPPIHVVEEYAARLPKGLPFEYILGRLVRESTYHPRYMLCDLRDKVEIIRTIESVEKLTPGQRYTFAAAPVDHRTLTGRQVAQALARCLAENQNLTIADIPEFPLEMLEKPMVYRQDYLENLVTLHKSLILFLWLSYRFVNNFKDQAMAVYARDMTEHKINQTLLEFSANPKLRRNIRRHYGPDTVQPGSAEHRVPEEVERSSMEETPFTLSSDSQEFLIEEEHQKPLAALAA